MCMRACVRVCVSQRGRECVCDFCVGDSVCVYTCVERVRESVCVHVC